MKYLIAVICLTLAAAPVSFAQDKAKDMYERVSSAVDKPAEAKQKAKRAKKACEKQAKAQKLKGDVRKKFMRDCMIK